MESQKQSLQSIYSFLLGLFFVIFVAVGMNTFYSYPTYDYSASSNNYNKCYSYTSDYQKDACLDKIQEESQAESKKIEAARSNWAMNSSIILVVIATIVIVVSLLFSGKLVIISNGMLLGSFFTLIYGTGMGFFSDNKIVRFVIVTVAFAITVIVGYLKFVLKKGGVNQTLVENSVNPYQENL